MTSAAGDYYSGALTQFSTYFNTEQTALSSLTSTILSKTVNFVNSFHNANSVCAESITSSFYDFIGANRSAAVTAALEETTYQDQMIDAEIAYYKALETAKANEAIEISQAKLQYHRTRAELNAIVQTYDNEQFESGASAPQIVFPIYTFYAQIFDDYYELNDCISFDYIANCFKMIRNSGEVYLETLHSFPEVYYETSADGTITTEEWNSICNKPQYLCNFEKTEANYRREEAEAQAKYTFIESYSSAYRAQVSADYGALETELSVRIAAGQTFNTSVWSAAETANASLLTAYDASDTTGDILTYLSGSVTRGNNLDTNLNDAFGDFQTAWRQDRLDGMTSSDPYYDAYSDDLTWAQRTVAARENAFAEPSSAEQDYYDTLFDSAGDYADAQTSASTAYSNRLFNALRTLASNQYGLDAAYQTSKLTAEKENTLDLLDAETAELLANALAETNAATEKRQAVSGFIADHQSALTVSSGSFKTLLNSMSVSDLPAQFNAMKNAAEASADASIASASTQNAQNMQASIDAANADYEYNVRVASNIFITGNLGYLTVSNNAVAAASELYRTALETAEDAYNEAVIPAWNDLQDESLRISILLGQAVDIINNGGIVPANYFTDPNISLEVCLPAGELIVLSDGTTKKIEDILFEDSVESVNHKNAAKGEIVAARVVRTFKNMPQPIWIVTFKNTKSGEEFQIRTTGGHRIYAMKPKGVSGEWLHIEDAPIGTYCRTGDDGTAILIAKLFDSTLIPVFNFEVEILHTYFVGANKHNSVLTHNAGCEKCGEDGWITTNALVCLSNGISYTYRYSSYCICQAHYIVTPKSCNDDFWVCRASSLIEVPYPGILIKADTPTEAVQLIINDLQYREKSGIATLRFWGHGSSGRMLLDPSNKQGYINSETLYK